MQNKMRISLAFFLVIFAVLLGSGAFWWSNHHLELEEELKETILQVANEKLNGRLEIDQLSIGFPPAVEVAGVRVIDSEERLALMAPKGRITIHYWELFKGQLGTTLLDTITLESLEVLASEDEKDLWNLESLVKGEEDSADLDLDLTVVVKNGKILLRRQENISADLGIDGQVHVGQKNSFRGSGKIKIGENIIAFDLSWKNNAGKINVKGTELSLKHGGLVWLPSQEPKISGWQGSVQLYNGEIVRDSEGQWSGQGEAVLTEVGLQIDEILFTQWNGKVSGSDKQISLTDLQGRINGEPLELNGKISLEEGHVLDLDVASRGFEIAKAPILDISPVGGVLRGQVHLGGLLAEPLIDGDLEIQGFSYEEQVLGDLQFSLKKEAEKIQLASAKGQVLQGNISGEGLFNWASREFSGKAVLKEIRLDALPVKLFPDQLLPLSGAVSGNISFQGTTADFVGEGALRFQNSLMGGVPISVLDGNIAVKEGQIASFRGEGSAAEGSFQIEKAGNRWDGEFQNLNFSQIQPLQSQFPVQGRFNGKVSGIEGHGKWQGTARLFGEQGNIAYQPFDTARGSFSLNSAGTVVIEELALTKTEKRSEYSGILEFLKEGSRTIIRNPREPNRFFPADDNPVPEIITRRHIVSGWFQLDGSNSDVAVVSENMRSETILSFLPPNFYLSGNLNNQLHIRGSLANPMIEGTVDMSRGSFGSSKEDSILVDRFSAGYERRNGTWKIHDLHLENWSFSIAGLGTFQETGLFDFEITQGRFLLDRPAFWNWPYPVKGTLYFNGKIQGNSEDVSFSMSAWADEILANQQKITHFTGEVQGDKNEIRITQLSFEQGASSIYSFEGYVQPLTGTVKGDLTVENAGLKELLPLLNQEVPGLDGILNGTISLDYRRPSVGLRVLGHVTEGTFRRQTLHRMDLDVEMRDRVWKIHDLSLSTGENGVLLAEGGMDQKGDLDIQIIGQNIDASFLPDLVSMDLPLKGSLQIVSQINGNIANPEAALSASIVNGSFGGTGFDDFHGLLTLKNRLVSIEQMNLKKDVYEASVHGTIPLAVLLREESARSESMDITIQLDHANLAILPAIHPFFSDAVGETNGKVNIRGSLDRPLIRGKVGIIDGMIYFQKVKKPLEDIQVEIEFLGDSFRVNQGQARMGKGTLGIYGQGGLAGTTLQEYEASLVMDRLEVDSPYYKGVLDGKFTLTSGVQRPLFSGNLNLKGVTISVPITFFLQDSGAFYLPEIGLNIDINVGDKVRLYDRLFYDISPRGALRVRNTIQKPVMEGSLEANTGRIWYFGTQFQVTDAKADFQYFQGLIPTVTLEAQYRMVNTVIFLRGDGLATEIDFRLSSEPSMSQEEIRNMLLFKNDQIDINSPEGQKYLASLGAMALLEMGLQNQGLFGLEDLLKERFGIDEVKIVQLQFRDAVFQDDPFKGFDNNYGIRIGKPLGDRLYATYAVSFADPANAIGTIRYDFNRYWNLSAEMEQYERNNHYQILLRGRF